MTDTEIATKLFVLREVVAHLVAHGAIKGHFSVDGLHEELVQRVAGVVAQQAPDVPLAQQFEALASTELDRLFSYAAGIVQRTPG